MEPLNSLSTIHQQAEEGTSVSFNSTPIPADPRVSIIICTFNRSQDLRRALASLGRLSYRNLEVIVVDNRSTDGTAEVIAEFPVKGILEERQGLSFARNCGVEAAEGDLILFFDDDITVECDAFIEQLVALLRSDPSIGIVGGLIRAVPVGRGNPGFAAIFLADQDYGPEARIVHEPDGLIGASLMYRRDAIGLDRFDPALGRRGKGLMAHEETDLTRRIEARGWRSAYCPHAVVKHWISGSRCTWRYALRHQFSVGLSDYLAWGFPHWKRGWRQPISEISEILLSIITFRRERFRRRMMRSANSLGILCGPIVKRLRQNR
jgi:glucosyl-dolichyl phosphate glucuronosyltransferase